MVNGLSFRSGVALLVTAYVVLAGVMVLGLGHDLWTAIPSYRPQVSWLMPETTLARVEALRANGALGTSGLYVLVVSTSWALIGALAAGGFAWGVLNKGDTVLGVDKALNYLTGLAALYAIIKLTELALHNLGGGLPSGGLNAMPGLWFATMIPSAAILARLSALGAHDAGVLIMTAIEAKPEELATRVANAEERRGPASLEARLARRMARMRRAV